MKNTHGATGDKEIASRVAPPCPAVDYFPVTGCRQVDYTMPKAGQRSAKSITLSITTLTVTVQVTLISIIYLYLFISFNSMN